MNRLLLLFILMISTLEPASSQAVKVEVKKDSEGYSLYRGGEKYYPNGAGGRVHINILKEAGGNSIRTWGLDEADEALEIAKKNDLTVMLGLWVQHERHGFNYDDEAAVKKQLEDFRAAVLKYKDHPNLLLWGIGNEVDLFYSNTKVWDAVQDIAAMVHELDPNHPTTTVTAGIDSMEVQLVKQKAPDIDIYGINTYGDIGRVPGQIKRYGWDGPYIIAEWGPNGHWEVEKTEWGSPVEQTSSEKAKSYEKRFKNYIQAERSHCIGSYVFLWGQKQETTSTWYGLFTEDGKPTEAIDVLHRGWKGEDPPNTSPTIKSVSLNGLQKNESVTLKSGEVYNATVDHFDADGDKVKVQWMVFPESSETKAGGDFENSLQPVLNSFRNRKKESCTLVAPEKEGPYRLMVFVTDPGKKTAYANIPFFVNPRTADDPPVNFIRFKEQQLEIK